MTTKTDVLKKKSILIDLVLDLCRQHIKMQKKKTTLSQ